MAKMRTLARRSGARISKRAVVCAVLGTALVAAAVTWWIIQSRLQAKHAIYVTRCANRALQLHLVVNDYMPKEARFPDVEEAREAFRRMDEVVRWGGPKWVEHQVCPEAFERDGSAGYIYVAGGLPTALAQEKRALVFFCPAESHRYSAQHAHASRAAGSICVKDNREMISILERAISQGRSGTVPYSRRAIERMEQELAKRRRPF